VMQVMMVANFGSIYLLFFFVLFSGMQLLGCSLSPLKLLVTSSD
jgi:hypothetical protein